ncbi:contactin-2-like [Labrus mixtus]|uniref:contactin-2-like n=1 Tax=Labrus mixtus TaxID=508554 RepID=UPI0029C0C7F2|nr:contactin-2-like [Labrus mixtus]
MRLEFLILGMITCFMKGAQCEATEVFAEAGSEALLPCKCSPSSTLPRAIIWSKANSGSSPSTIWRMERSGMQYWGSGWTQKGIQRARCTNSQLEIGDYSLQINSVREEDGGYYTCRVSPGDQVPQNRVLLRVIKVTISPSVAIWGEDVSITCNVTPWPNAANVKWTLNNSPFVHQAEMNSIRQSPKKVLREEANSRVTGNWTCVVDYKGKVVQASSTLTVNGIINPSTDSTKLYSAVGSEANLPCVLSPGLNLSSSAWEKLKPGSLFKPVTGHLPTTFSPSSPSSQTPWDISASLKEVKFEDEGKYRCSATTGGQQLTRIMQLVVAKIESSVVSKKKGSVTLTCQLTDTSDVTDYEWVHVVYGLNGTQSFGSIKKGKTLILNKVSEENWDEWVCRFYGKQGILGNVTHHSQLTSGLTGEKSSAASPNTAAIVGLSLLLLVLLLILAQMYKNHRRRKRIFQYPALETIVHTASNQQEERERSRGKK